MESSASGSPNAVRKRKETRQNGSSRSQRGILLVQRDAAQCEALAGVLKEQGYRVLQASDGASALGLGDELRFVDLALIDLAIAPMSALDLADRLQEAISPELSVLYTADGAPESGNPARPLLTRPIPADLLLATVECIFDFG